MNIQNMNLFNGDLEQAINIAKLIKDKYDQSKKNTGEYSGLQAYVINELYVDGGVTNKEKVIKDYTFKYYLF